MTLNAVLRRVPPAAVDLLITAAVLAAHSAPFLLTTRAADPVQGWTLAHYLPVLGESLPLFWRRRAPVLVLVVTMAATVIYGLPDPDTARQPIAYGALVATYTLAATGSRRQRAYGLTLGIGAHVVSLLVSASGKETIVTGAVTFVAAWAIGRSMAHRQAYARRLELEQEQAAERAAARERATLARDMHDILGHAISLMIVQAEAGPVALRTDPSRVERAFDAIAAAGRTAMTQVRWTLGLLDGDLADGVPAIDRIPALVTGVDRAGLRTGLRVSGQARPVPPDVDATAYRVVQEALTNTVKHSRASEVTVDLTWQPESLLVTVTDNGCGASGVTGHGNGLAGMRSRAEACGGSAEFGAPSGGPGFTVSAHLPLGRP